jgi:hypothetical protein
MEPISEPAPGGTPHPRTGRSRRPVGAAIAAAVVAVVVAATVVAVVSRAGSGPSPAAARAPVAPPARAATPPASAGGPPRPAASPAAPSPTLIATLKADTPRFPSPGAPSDGTVPGTWYGSVSALPVLAQQPGWDQVRLAQRPNGSTAWIPADDATITETDYRIDINLTTEHLELWDGSKLVLDAPAGVGTTQDPTATGQFFLALFARSPSSGYGPFVMVTSAHSDSITDWEQSGDAIIAIHGPLGADSAIGTTGARISHGCVRLHDTDLMKLRPVPAGTPITITA